MSHAYDTHKPGLKTKHLGFHKALCVLMGWNWHVAPDTSKAYQSVLAEEVNAMRRDRSRVPGRRDKEEMRRQEQERYRGQGRCHTEPGLVKRPNKFRLR